MEIGYHEVRYLDSVIEEEDVVRLDVPVINAGSEVPIYVSKAHEMAVPHCREDVLEDSQELHYLLHRIKGSDLLSQSGSRIQQLHHHQSIVS